MRGRESDTEYPLKLEEGQKHRSMTVEDRFLSREVRRLWQETQLGGCTIPEPTRLERDSGHGSGRCRPSPNKPLEPAAEMAAGVFDDAILRP